MFIKAQRKQAKLRLALCGPSGGGKTHGALLIAKGLNGKTAMLDTERGSGSLYADLMDYDICHLEAPFSPQAYIEAIKGAEKAGYNTLIIDSLSHAWSGVGGVLDMHDNATRTSKSQNSYFAWKDVTPQHNKLIDTILQSPLHIIVCMRVKTAYEITDNDKGKKAPVKIGLAPIQKDGLEYEFTAVLDLSPNSNIYTSSKDRTGLFHGRSDVITVETGENLLKWLNAGISDAERLSMISWRFGQADTLDKLKEEFLFLRRENPDLIGKIDELKDLRKTQIMSMGAKEFVAEMEDSISDLYFEPDVNITEVVKE